MNDLIFPRALVTAAKTFAKKPKVLGEVLIALVTGETKDLSEVQQYIVAECRAELEYRQSRRESARERKRRQRAREVR